MSEVATYNVPSNVSGVASYNDSSNIPQALESGRFESRWVTVGIEDNTPAIMFDGMQGSKLGVWIAHGEGKVKFPDGDRMAPIVANGQAAVRYVVGCTLGNLPL
jgi:phosphoribosylformylglycinamidine (FGAM) synthase-like amidotransferase family enzyme